MVENKQKSSKLLIADPIYKIVSIEPHHRKYLEMPELQRLRHINQTSFVNNIYPSANHTRFAHSIGVYHLMKKFVNNKMMDIDEKNKENLMLAGLFHDIGHGPFSHFWEKAFPHFDHEKATQDILKKNGLHEVADIVAHKNPYYQLLSSTIDVDKLDYMNRDAYFTGVSNGIIQTDYIIEKAYVKNSKVIIKPSAITSVEELIAQRVTLFKTLYYHKEAIQYDFIFTKIFERVRELLKNNADIEVNKNLKAFFEKKDTIKDLLALNDHIILAHIYSWANHKDKVLSKLCQMFTENKKLNVINSTLQKTDMKKIKNRIKSKEDRQYFFGEITCPIKVVQTELYVEFDGKLKKIEEVSNLIKFFKEKNFNTDFIIYPKG